MKEYKEMEIKVIVIENNIITTSGTDDNDTGF